MCQMIDMDVFSQPVLTLCAPYELSKNKTKFAIKDGRNITEYNVSKTVSEFFSNISKSEKGRYAAQLRCIKIGGPLYSNQYPQNGYIKVPGTRFRQDFVTAEPPNDTKKRKDPFLEIDCILKVGRNKIEGAHVETKKDSSTYMVGLFLIKKFTDEEILDYYMKNCMVPVTKSFEQIQGKFNIDQQDAEVQIQIEESYALVLKTFCPITLTLLKYPARGER